MMKLANQIFIGVLFAAISISLLLAPTLSNQIAADAKKPEKDKKPKKCDVKVQVKVNNVKVNSTVTVTLGGITQEKLADASSVGFMFQYKKGGATCPVKGDSIGGLVNGDNQFNVVIKDAKGKPNKVTVTLQ